MVLTCKILKMIMIENFATYGIAKLRHELIAQIPPPVQPVLTYG